MLKLYDRRFHPCLRLEYQPASHHQEDEEAFQSFVMGGTMSGVPPLPKGKDASNNAAIMENWAPRNVVVDSESHIRWIVDLAKCSS